jgi:cytochrome c peroxidase
MDVTSPVFWDVAGGVPGKVYMHNGVFKSLKEVVRFYNARDPGNFPSPEVKANMNTEELGNLGPTDEEENAVVAFLKSLSDHFVPGKK